MYNNELYHHGIKGMHWGIRRFQNPDGTLTNAGRRRERKQQSKIDRVARKEMRRERKRLYKNSSLMTDAELDANIRRLQKEKQYKSLSRESLSPGRTKVSSMLDRYGNQAIGTALGSAIGVGTGIFVKNYLHNHGYNVGKFKSNTNDND